MKKPDVICSVHSDTWKTYYEIYLKSRKVEVTTFFEAGEPENYIMPLTWLIFPQHKFIFGGKK